jgi:hypothetical protein
MPYTTGSMLDGTSAEQIGPILMPILIKDIILHIGRMPTYKQVARHMKIVSRFSLS